MPRRCPICRSKQWHRQPGSGLVVCSEGHVLQNYRNETNEQLDVMPHALNKRTLKSKRRKAQRVSKADPQLYHGDRATFHYFQCLQLLLRKQISVLLELWKLPPEFEVVCRDVWALNLTCLPEPPPPEPYLFACDPATLQEELVDNVSTSSSSDDEDPTSTLLREASLSGSGESEIDQCEPDPLDEVKPSRATRRRKRDHTQSRHPSSTVATLMLACWILRVPVIYMDFIRLTESHTLPYFEPSHYLPSPMARHLTKQTIQSLSPQVSPRPAELHTVVQRLAKLFHLEHGIYTPEYNAAPVLWRGVQALRGSPTLYTLSKATARLLSLPLTLHQSLSSKLPQRRPTDPTAHKRDIIVPELSLIACVILVLKLTYGLDGERSRTATEFNAVSALPQLPKYVALLEDLAQSEKNSIQSMLTFSHDVSILDLDNAILDEYLDFCQQALPGESAPLIAAEYFPLSRQERKPGGTHEDPSLYLPANRPGEQPDGEPSKSHVVFRGQDLGGHIPEELNLVLEASSRWVGCSVDEVLSVVETFERRLGIRRYRD